MRDDDVRGLTSNRPYGTERVCGYPYPSDESLGYYQASLRDPPTADIFGNAGSVFRRAGRAPDLAESAAGSALREAP